MKWVSFGDQQRMEQQPPAASKAAGNVVLGVIGLGLVGAVAALGVSGKRSRDARARVLARRNPVILDVRGGSIPDTRPW